VKPICQWLHNGRKLHLQHGPIDLIIEVIATDSAVANKAYDLAIERFQSVLTELVKELPALRLQTDTSYCQFNGSIAQRMWRAASRLDWSIESTPYRLQHDRQSASHGSSQSFPKSFPKSSPKGSYYRNFLSGATTPMIAVAGSVADEILAAITSTSADQLLKVCVNNGGDIALYLNHDQCYRVGVVANPVDVRVDATIELKSTDNISGVASSGWRGRSHSFGIADSVTVLADSAATADAAATLIANAVDCSSADIDSTEIDKPLIERRAANELDPDSDLGDAPVTTSVDRLPQAMIDIALDAGCNIASQLEQQKLISGACLFLQGRHRVVGTACQSVAAQLADTNMVDSEVPGHGAADKSQHHKNYDCPKYSTGRQSRTLKPDPVTNASIF